MSVDSEALRAELARILDSQFSIRGYFHALFQLLLKETGQLIPEDPMEVIDELYTEETLSEVLSVSYPLKKHVLLFYAHSPHSHEVSFVNRDCYPKHTCLVLGYVGKDGKIEQVLNIDGYNNPDYVDVLGITTGRAHPYIHHRLLVDVLASDSSDRVPLQAASWRNINCPMYAFAMARTLLRIAREKPEILDIFRDDVPNPAGLNVLKEEIILGLSQDKSYVDERRHFNHSLCENYHRSTRRALHDRVLEDPSLAQEVMKTRAPPTKMALERTWCYPRLTASQLREDFSSTELDNYSIVSSAAEVLRVNGFTDFHTLLVGPERVGGAFDFNEQLSSKFRGDKRYSFLALPTNRGRHSVTVVIDTSEKKVIVVDPLNHPLDYDEAIHQVKKATEGGVLSGYKIVRPPEPQTAQQSDHFSCGVHTAANIVGILLGTLDVTNKEALGMRTPSETRNLWRIFHYASRYHAESLAQYQQFSAQKRMFVQVLGHFKMLLESVELPNLPLIAAVTEFEKDLAQELPKDDSDDALFEQTKSLEIWISNMSKTSSHRTYPFILDTLSLRQITPSTEPFDLALILNTAASKMMEQSKCFHGATRVPPGKTKAPFIPD